MKRLWRAAFCSAAAIAASAQLGWPDETHGAAVPIGRKVAPPPGFYSFCIREKDQCASDGNPADRLHFDERLLKTLRRVNDDVNDNTIPLDDAPDYGRREYWAIVRNGYGDCDDMVVTKRAELHKAGLPLHDLRIAIARSPHRTLHALLMITTDQGDYILDSLTPSILRWDDTDYDWIERQDGTEMGWESMNRPMSKLQIRRPGRTAAIPSPIRR